MQIRFLIPSTLLLLAVGIVRAQVVIQPRDIPNRPGTVMAYWSAADSAEGIEVNVGDAGADRRWDLSGYRFDEVTYDTLLDPAEAPGHEAFDNANRALRSALNELGMNLGTGVQFEAVTDSGWYMLGVQGGGILGQNQPLVYPNPLLILPLPAEYEDTWDIAFRFEFGFPAPDTLMGGILDSVYVRLALGGFSTIDGTGVVVYSGGEVPALRQHISVAGHITLVGTRIIFGRRIEVEIPFGIEIQAMQTYRWLCPSVGEIARMSSMVGEENADFNLASSIRVRRVIPALAFPNPPLAFGVVHVGNSGMGQLVIRNSGEGIGSISRVAFTDSLEREIEVITQLPMIVEPDTLARLRFLWSPTIEKSLWPNTVSIFHNDPEQENPLVFLLQGATPEFQSVGDGQALPVHYEAVRISPNPFNGTARVNFQLETASFVMLSIFNLKGEQVWSESLGYLLAGEQNRTLQAEDLASGVYLLRLNTGDRIFTSKIALVR